MPVKSTHMCRSPVVKLPHDSTDPVSGSSMELEGPLIQVRFIIEYAGLIKSEFRFNKGRIFINLIHKNKLNFQVF